MAKTGAHFGLWFKNGCSCGEVRLCALSVRLEAVPKGPVFTCEGSLEWPGLGNADNSARIEGSSRVLDDAVADASGVE